MRWWPPEGSRRHITPTLTARSTFSHLGNWDFVVIFSFQLCFKIRENLMECLKLVFLKLMSCWRWSRCCRCWTTWGSWAGRRMPGWLWARPGGKNAAQRGHIFTVEKWRTGEVTWESKNVNCQRIKFQWKKGSTFSHLLTVRAPPTPLAENYFAQKPLAELGGTPPPLAEKIR